MCKEEESLAVGDRWETVPYMSRGMYRYWFRERMFPTKGGAKRLTSEEVARIKASGKVMDRIDNEEQPDAEQE